MASLKRFATFGGAAPAPTSDPQFNLTTLLLHGDGTNGAQNNTFVDSSSNNFTITRNGNTTQGTFTPFSQTGWGNFCSGGNRLAANDASKLELGSSDFTIEFFAYFTQFPTNQAMVFEKGVFATTRSYRAYIGATQLFFELNLSGSATGAYTSINLSTTTSLNVWHHFAFVRSGSTVYIFRNGVLIGTGAVSGTVFDNAAPLTFGGPADGNSIFAFTGHLSNFRITTGQAFSTVTFIAPSSPLTTSTTGWLTASQNPISLTGTVAFLTAQSNRFIDVSASPTNITIAAGAPSVQAFSPFAPTSAYSTSVVGGSGYFDGTGDYLSVADNAALRLGTSAFTIQCWVYRSVAGIVHGIIAKGGTNTGYVLRIGSTNVLEFIHGATTVGTTTTIPAGAWTHVAAVRTSTGTNGFQLYINGVSSATATVATDLNQTDILYICASRSALNTMNGYISGLRYVVGTAETITIPTAPPSPTGAALLTNFTDAGIIDNTAKNDLETVSSAQISTAESKFGGSSILFDGTGDYLQAPASVNNLFGTGDFTIEAWVYIAGNSAQNNSAVRDAGILALSSASQAALGLVILGNATTTGTGLQLFQNVPVTSDLKVTGTISQLTWHHIAVSRAGTSVRFFLNGTQMGATQTNSSSWGSSTFPLFVGSFRLPGFLDDLNGYIDDLRVTRGFARYTANFTPPTAPFPDQ